MSKTMAKLFAEKIKAARKTAGLTQRQLAEKSGIHQAVIARYETGNAMPRQKAIDKLAKTLGVPLATFEPTKYSATLTVSVNIPLHSLDESVLKVMEIKKAIKEIDDARVEVSLVSIREAEINWQS